MPACTGLPPGELMSSTTAFAPSSSKAAFRAALINSALASAPSAISPLISTTAVCGAETLPVLGAPRCITNQINAPKNSNHARRTKVFQRRVAFCSFSAANASFSSVLRSQLGWSVGSFLFMLLAILSGAFCARIDWSEGSFFVMSEDVSASSYGSWVGSMGSGRLGSVMIGSLKNSGTPDLHCQKTSGFKL